MPAAEPSDAGLVRQGERGPETGETRERGSSLGHVPAGERWKFDEDVTDCFDDMLVRSIPQYRVMRRAVFGLGRRFVDYRTKVVDLGCSRGEALGPFVDEFSKRACTFLGVDKSPPMLEAARRRFQREISAGIVEIASYDLRRDYPRVKNVSLTLSVLLLQFTPIEYRQKIVSGIYRTTNPGGALILVEKVLGSSSVTDDVLVEEYLEMKRENGYTDDEIERKRMSLEGVLVPVTAKWNEELLHEAGFARVECFWRWMNFAGWIAVKG